MSVPTTQPMMAKTQNGTWRREYIRLLTEPFGDVTGETHEGRERLERIDELTKAGYMRGHVSRDAGMIPQRASVTGITLAGRIFAEEQQDILDSQSVTGRLKAGAGLFVGWLSGILSALIIQYLTQ